MSTFIEYATTSDAFLRLFLRNAFYIIAAFYTLSNRKSNPTGVIINMMEMEKENENESEIDSQVPQLPQPLLTRTSAVEIITSCSKYALLTAMHFLRCECATRVVKHYMEMEQRTQDAENRGKEGTEGNTSPFLLVAQHVIDVLDSESVETQVQANVLRRIHSCMVAGMVEVFLREYGGSGGCGGDVDDILDTPSTRKEEGIASTSPKSYQKSNINDEVEERFLLAAALSVGPREHIVSTTATGASIGIPSSSPSPSSSSHLNCDVNGGHGRKGGGRIEDVDGNKEDEEEESCPPPLILLQVFPYLGWCRKEEEEKIEERRRRRRIDARSEKQKEAEFMHNVEGLCRIDYGCMHYWGREVLPLLVLSMSMERKAISFDQRRRLQGAWRVWLLKQEMKQLMNLAEKHQHLHSTIGGGGGGVDAQSDPQIKKSKSEFLANEERLRGGKPKEVHFSTESPSDSVLCSGSRNAPKDDKSVSEAAVLVLERVNAIRLQQRVYNVWKNHFAHPRVALRLLVANRELQMRQRCFCAWKVKLSVSRKKRAARTLRAAQDKERLGWWKARKAALIKEAVLYAWGEQVRVLQFRRRYDAQRRKDAWTMWKRAYTLYHAYNTESPQRGGMRVEVARVFPGSLKRSHARAGMTSASEVSTTLISSGIRSIQLNSNNDESRCDKGRGECLEVSTSLPHDPWFTMQDGMDDGPWKRFTFGTECIHVRCLQNILSVCLSQWKRRGQERTATHIAHVKLVQRFYAHLQANMFSRRQSLIGADVHRTRSVLRGCWKRWVNRAVVVRPLLRRVLAIHQRSLVQMCWKMWKEKYVRKTLEERRVVDIRTARLDSMMRSALERWKCRTRLSQSELQVRHMVCRTRLARCFRLWSLRSSVQRRYSRDRIALADLFLDQLCVKRAWLQWRHTLASRRQRSEEAYHMEMKLAADTFRRQRIAWRVFSYWKSLSRFRCHHREWSVKSTLGYTNNNNISSGSSIALARYAPTSTSTSSTAAIVGVGENKRRRIGVFKDTNFPSRDSTTNGSLSISVQPLPAAPFIRNVGAQKHVSVKHPFTRTSKATGLNVSTQPTDYPSRTSPEATDISVASASVHSSTFSIPSFLQLRPHRNAARQLLFSTNQNITNNTNNSSNSNNNNNSISGASVPEKYGDASIVKSHEKGNSISKHDSRKVHHTSLSSSSQNRLQQQQQRRGSSSRGGGKSVYFAKSNKSIPFRDPNNLRNYEPYIYEGIHRNRSKLFDQLPSRSSQQRRVPIDAYTTGAKSGTSSSSSSSSSEGETLRTRKCENIPHPSAAASMSSVSVSPPTIVLPPPQPDPNYDTLQSHAGSKGTFEMDPLNAAADSAIISSSLRSLSLSSISRSSSPAAPHAFQRSSTPPIFSGVTWTHQTMGNEDDDDIEYREDTDHSMGEMKHQHAESNRDRMHGRIALTAPPPLAVIEVEMDANDEVRRELKENDAAYSGNTQQQPSSHGERRGKNPSGFESWKANVATTTTTTTTTPLRPTLRSSVERGNALNHPLAPVYFPFGGNEEASPDSYSPYSVQSTEYHPSP